MQKVFRTQGAQSLLHRCNPILHRCKSSFGWCKRLFGDFCSAGPKDLLHPPLSTFGNFPFSVNFPGPQLPNPNSHPPQVCPRELEQTHPNMHPPINNDFENNSLRYLFVILKGFYDPKILAKEGLFDQICVKNVIFAKTVDNVLGFFEQVMFCDRGGRYCHVGDSGTLSCAPKWSLKQEVYVCIVCLVPLHFMRRTLQPCRAKDSFENLVAQAAYDPISRFSPLRRLIACDILRAYAMATKVLDSIICTFNILLS